MRGVGAAGFTDKAKSGVGATPAVTVNVTEVWRSNCGRVELPVTVRLYAPVGVFDAVDTTSKLVVDPPAEGVTNGGEKLPAELNGNPLTCNEIGELKLPIDVTPIL